MQWISDVILKDSTAHTVLLLCLAIFPGIWIGNRNVFGIRIGIAGVLFSGLAVGAIGLPLDSHILHFIREFGLILFVFSIGLQVGPGFFANFKNQGVLLNAYAAAIVFLGLAVAIVEKSVLKIPVEALVGILSGAVTNTPGLGAAQQALKDAPGLGDAAAAISGTGYAVAYPFGIVGIIITMLLVRWFFRVKIADEAESFKAETLGTQDSLQTFTVEVKNPLLWGKTIHDLSKLLDHGFVISRLCRNGDIQVPEEALQLAEGDLLHVVCNKRNLDKVTGLVGAKSDQDLRKSPSEISVWKILVSKSSNGQSLHQGRFQERLGVRITRVLRSGMEILPTPALELHVGDHVTAVGTPRNLQAFSAELGDSRASLHHPNLLPIFLGILAGVLLGSMPIAIPGLPSPVKLGMAGGPLIIALLMGFKRTIGSVSFFLPPTASLFMREFGILLFLAAVGLGSGESFLASILEGSGLYWMSAGIAITLLPLLLVGIVARLRGLNYLTLSGLLAGAMTDPPALGYATSLSASPAQSTAYASVYPLTMFLRIMTAQVFVMLCLPTPA